VQTYSIATFVLFCRALLSVMHRECERAEGRKSHSRSNLFL